MWKFLVKNQSIEIMEREVLADHQIQYVQFRFIFEGDWKHFHKVVQFTQGEDTYNIVLGFDGTSCYLPAELHVGAVKMSLFGYDAESDTTVRATTVPVTLNIRASGFVGDDDLPIPPTPDLYTQLLQQLNQYTSGGAGKSAYELAVQEGFTGSLSEWLQSLHGRDGADGRDGQNGRDGIDGSDGVSPDISEITTIIQQIIGELPDQGHVHNNKEVLDSITAEMVNDLDGLQQYKDSTKYDLQTLNEAVENIMHKLHEHDNIDILNNISAEVLAELQGLQQFRESVNADIQSIREELAPVAEKAHQHQNSAVLDDITAGYTIEERRKINSTLLSLQAQIDNMHSLDGSITLFHSGNSAIPEYGEKLYTFYIDGYRSLSGFADVYHSFCCAENDYAISYNQPDFNWGAEIYTMCVTPVRINGNSKMLFSYKCGFNEGGEMWLVHKSQNELSAAETARYIHEQIIQGGAISVPFSWLESSDTYITVLLSREDLPTDDYYLAWKAVTDNTHPQIRLIKILEVMT